MIAFAIIFALEGRQADVDLTSGAIARGRGKSLLNISQTVVLSVGAKTKLSRAG